MRQEVSSGTIEDQTKKESVSIQQAVSVEHQWWYDWSIEQLVEVPDEGKNYRLIWRLRTGEEPKLARPELITLLGIIEERWRLKAAACGLPTENIFLSVTSLYRDAELQKKLKESTPLASEGFGSHGLGVAVDFDPNGYYFGEERKAISSFSPDFVPTYTMMLRQTLASLEAEELCYVIYEKRFRKDGTHIVSYEACYHVCVNPEINQKR